MLRLIRDDLGTKANRLLIKHSKQIRLNTCQRLHLCQAPLTAMKVYYLQMEKCTLLKKFLISKMIKSNQQHLKKENATSIPIEPLTAREKQKVVYIFFLIFEKIFMRAWHIVIGKV